MVKAVLANNAGGGIMAATEGPFSEIKDDQNSQTASAREVNAFHASSDVDSSAQSQHHTLGVKHTQASFGDHIHDGISSRKLGEGMSLTLTGSKGGNVALDNLIDMLKNFVTFTDSTT